MLSLCINSLYINFRLHKNGENRFCNLHRILAEHFIPNSDNKPEVNHIKGNKHDNRLENLEWATCSENIQHAFKTNLKVSPRRSKHYAAKPIMIIDIKKGSVISFPCVKDASEKMRIGETTIWSNINGVNKSCKYKFEYI